MNFNTEDGRKYITFLADSVNHFNFYITSSYLTQIWVHGKGCDLQGQRSRLLARVPREERWWPEQQSPGRCPACSLLSECPHHAALCHPFNLPPLSIEHFLYFGNYLGRYSPMSPFQHLNEMLLYLLDRWGNWSVKRLMAAQQLGGGDAVCRHMPVWLSVMRCLNSQGVTGSFPVCMFSAPFIPFFSQYTDLPFCVESKRNMLSK